MHFIDKEWIFFSLCILKKQYGRLQASIQNESKSGQIILP